MEKQYETEAWEVLNDLRHGYSEEIPNEVIHGKKFKVRKNWFTAIVGTLAIFVEEGVITNPELTETVNKFRERYLSDKFHNQNLVTTSDIEEGNKILDLVLSSRDK